MPIENAMDDTTPALQDKLKRRREAMTMHESVHSSPQNAVGADNDSGNEDSDNISTLEDQLDNIEEGENVATSRLKGKLETRHDATRRRLQKSQIHTPVLSHPSVNNTRESTPSEFPVISAGQSQDFASPRSDLSSFPRNTLGRSTGTTSLRSRLQEKLQATKSQRALSPMNEERKRTQRLKDRISFATRFDDPLRSLSRSELEKERELESKISAKLQWKKAMRKARDQGDQPSEADCYDFFTKQFDDEYPPEPEPVLPTTDGEEQAELEVGTQSESVAQTEDPPGAEVETELDTEEEKKKLLADIIPVDLDFKLFAITAAEYIGYRVQIENEQKACFVPSILEAPAESKVLDNDALVYLEEEGFYVGVNPKVQIRNRNILENRILKQEQSGHHVWFGPDGRIQFLPNPVKMALTKPWVTALEVTDPSIETVYVKAYERFLEDKYLQGAEEYELHVDIGTVTFYHHPLMSREHVLASKLNELYEAYVKHRHKNYAVFYHEKLRTLRLTLRTMKRTAAMEGQDNVSALKCQELRIQDYTSEILRTCRQRDLAEDYERDLVRKIIAQWKGIQSLRTTQGFINTTVKLTVKKQEINEEIDRAEWMKEIDTQLEERVEDYYYNVQYPYRKQMTEYQNSFQDWKKTNIKLKKQQQQKLVALRKRNEEQIDSTGEGIVVGSNPKPLKPLPPAKFDENTVREQLIKNALRYRRNPGEPKISLEVTNVGTATANHLVPPGEAARRRSLQNSTLSIKVKFNGRDVCTSETKSITADFRTHFGQIFKIFISQWPDSVKVQLCDVGRLNDSVLDEISLSLPDGSVNSANAQIFPVKFSSDRIVSYPNHEGVGSSTPFSLQSSADGATTLSLKTRGYVFLSIAWGLAEGGQVLAPKVLTQHGENHITGGQPVLKTTRVLNTFISKDSELTELWSQEGKLDPNDPSHSGLLTYVDAKEGFAPAIDFFRFDHMQDQFNFTTDEDLANARRLKILEYRTKGIAEFRNLNMIPANEHEILDSAFTTYERRRREKDSLSKDAEQMVAAGTLSMHRLEVLRFRQRVRDSVLRRFYTARHYHTLQDVVVEEEVPDISTLGGNLLKVFEPRRPLKPVRTERKKATTQNLTDGCVSILVSVVRAYNLPIREKTPLPVIEGSLSRSLLGSTAHQLQGDSNDYKLSPFVSISFQGNVKTTTVAQGPNPSWNEEMTLSFSATNNDYSSQNLQILDDTLFIHIFDRIVMDATIDTRDRSEIGETSGVNTGIVSHRIQNHWLGSLKIPFSTIYQQGKIDGTFKINLPLVMLGYTMEKGQPRSDDPYVQMQTQFLQPQEGSYLTMFVTLEPELGRPEPAPQKFETQEDQQLIDDSLKFVAECKKKFPMRKVKATVIDVKGESVFITRYIRPLPPPPSLVSSENSMATAQKLARYVSLIPFVSDNVLYAGTCDLWSTCDQFLDMLCGDEEEHAVLLVNYFLHIGKKAYLVLGSAIPEGDTAYVLTMELGQENLLWNASTGQHYKTSDGLCPLQGVHALVNQDNVWFNMQVHDMPSRMNFDMSAGRWKPLFRSATTFHLPSVQPESLEYKDANMSFVQNLEERIERTLKDAVMNWRSRHVTRWNRSVSTALRQILQDLELNRFKTDGTTLRRDALSDNDHTVRLTKLIGSARFVGFPMDMSFTDIDAIVKAVRSTEVHKIQDNDIEFALAVHIHPYPASVLCVWIYLAAVNNRKVY